MNRTDAELIARQVSEQLEVWRAEFRAELAGEIKAAIERHAKENPLGLTPEQIEGFSEAAFKTVRGFVSRTVQPLRQRLCAAPRFRSTSI